MGTRSVDVDLHVLWFDIGYGCPLKAGGVLFGKAVLCFELVEWNVSVCMDAFIFED